MIPEFTQAIFLKSLDEWGAYPARFKALSPAEQAEFLKTQGYASLHDMLAHVGVWWEEAEAIIRDALGKQERPRRKYDFDEFNAASLARFKDTSEEELLKWYESTRQAMLALVSALDAQQIKVRRVYGWLDAVTLLHLKEHGVAAPRFLALDMLQREWYSYAGKFHALTDEQKAEFLAKQGFGFRELIGHIIGGWEDGIQIMDATAKNPSYRAPEKDNDEFNAQLAKLYGAWDEADVLKRYEQLRLALIELVINLPDETYDHKEVQAWIRSDVIEHYFAHSL